MTLILTVQSDMLSLNDASFAAKCLDTASKESTINATGFYIFEKIVEHNRARVWSEKRIIFLFRHENEEKRPVETGRCVENIITGSNLCFKDLIYLTGLFIEYGRDKRRFPFVLTLIQWEQALKNSGYTQIKGSSRRERAADRRLLKMTICVANIFGGAVGKWRNKRGSCKRGVV